jgi:asparagine synthase (glutamine-hydrolysing)
VCGIAGIFHRDGEPVSRQEIEQMNALQAHRGPDGDGIFLDEEVGLGHRRLAIIDLTEAGHQPLTLEGHSISYNGEVYNYRELRLELEALDHTFRSDCDTEVVLRSYLQWGRNCVKRFNGMFAFAIWNAKDRVLFCARDRLGIKPFFYFQHNETFEFASELKALLRKPERRVPRLRTLVRFMGEGLTDDEWDTFYRRMRMLPPAHTMMVSRRGIELDRYWRIDPGQSWKSFCPNTQLNMPPQQDRLVEESYFPNTLDLNEAAHIFRGMFAESVNLRMRSDVPVGTCLSGGLDSSSVVTCASELISHSMETFSSVYTDPGYDEKSYIDDVVKACHTNPHSIESDGRDLPDIFDKIVWAQDEPTAGPGLYSQWKVMETAQKSVTVLLDGQGGDELLAGYYHYFREYLSELAKQLVANKQDLQAVFRAAEIIKDVTGTDHTALAERAIRRAKRPKILSMFQKDRPGRVKTPELLHPDLVTQFSKKDATRMEIDKIFDNSLSQKLYNDLTRFSIPPLLRYEDRNSMAFSLEARVPFLDHRLIEFCFALPNQFKIDPPHTKLVLRKAMNGRLPKTVTKRQDKLGYPTPVANWLREGLNGWIQDLLHSQSFQECELLHASTAMKIYEDHMKGADRSWDLWRVLHVYRWNELYLKGKGFSAVART